MKFKTSFFNKGILINDLKRFSWIGIIYLLGLFFAIPLRMLMTYSDIQNNYYYIENNPIKRIFDFRAEEPILLTVVIPVLLAIFLFRYMQVKKSTDMIHSLPIKRKNLYNNQILIGITFLILPVIITCITAIILNSTLNFNEYYTKDILKTIDILRWAGISILMDIVIFMFSVCIGMLTGISVVQGVLTYIFLFLPVGFSGLIFFNIQEFIYGFNMEYYLRDKIFILSPLTRVFEVRNENMPMSTKEVLVYIIICIILYFVSRFIYNKRNLESASQSIAFSKLKPVFKYGVTFCSMLFGGFYFGETQESIYWIFFGYFISSLIGYFVAEIVINKSLRVFRNIKGYFIYSIVVVILLLGVKFDIIGYEGYVPDLKKVESIYFDTGFYKLREPKEKVVFYYEKENLKNIQELHKKIIQHKENKNDKNSNQRIALVYNLKNGKKVARGYYIKKEDYSKYFKPIYESKEYKKINFDIFNVKHIDIEKITIYPIENVNKKAVITDSEDIKEALEILKSETLNQKYEDMIDERIDWADINILLADNKKADEEDKYDHTMYFGWEKSFTQFEKWLKKEGYIENARTMPKDIAYAVVEKREGKERDNLYIDEKNKNVKRLDIFDKNKIEICLRNYESKSDEDVKYIIGFYSEDKNSINYGTFDENNAPDFIKEYFK
ncbi:DUF6449 domain-containing protein [Tepidibacter formicigenes]|uniref:ABC-2 type transport system permease protein n=1 Tax=Tepidibacter formicigenes DSM 15518 TaxID=1123349 RepID=A0A1M6J7R4_9FIRM|nr:DUF6449 domain-containing protein [Tepidibacter formicigenes]SHJ42720.1 ABC-2 type transport system permease protein [Tepidibacter formicigenes DSM 15518]